MTTTAEPTTDMQLPAVASSAPKSPSKRRVLHIYDRRDGEVANELGVQVRMLCGVWGWPSRRKNQGGGVTTAQLTSRDCKRCARVLAREEREARA